MKILIVSHYFYPHVGGIEIVAYNQAKELIKEGYTVVLVTSKVGLCKSEETIEGIKIIRVPAFNILEKLLDVPFPLFSPKIFFVLKKEIQATDIVYAHGILYASSLLAIFIARIYKKTVILSEHVGFVQYKSSILNIIESIAFNTIGKLNLQLSSIITALNLNVKQFLQTLTSKKIVILPNGVDTKLFHPISKGKKIVLRKKYSLPINRMIVLFVGRFVEKKGIELIKQAKNDSFDLVFVGSGKFPENRTTDKQIHVLGSLPQYKLAELYQACDIFLLPSKSEGFPLSIQEAMASGLPIITSFNNKVDKSLHTRYIKYIKLSPIAISKAIKDIASNKKLYQKMGEYSYGTAQKHFSWEKNVRILLTACTNL